MSTFPVDIGLWAGSLPMTWRKQWKIAKVFGPLRLTWEIWMKLLAPAFRLICCWLLWPSRECATRWKRPLYLSVLLSLQFVFFHFKDLFMYLFESQIHTHMQWKRETPRPRPMHCPLVHLPTLSKHWAFICCLPRYISRKLNGKRNSWYSNWHSIRPVLQHGLLLHKGQLNLICYNASTLASP